MPTLTPEQVDRLLDRFFIVYDATEDRTLGSRDLYPQERRAPAVSMLVVNVPGEPDEDGAFPEGERDPDGWQ